jgi:hypothetical protein
MAGWAPGAELQGVCCVSSRPPLVHLFVLVRRHCNICMSRRHSAGDAVPVLGAPMQVQGGRSGLAAAQAVCLLLGEVALLVHSVTAPDATLRGYAAAWVRHHPHVPV